MATKFWDRRKNTRIYSKHPKSSEKKPRTCYNCVNSQHFVIDCPYEKRWDNGGQLIRKKGKFSPKPKNFMKKSPQEAFVSSHEEYFK